MSEGFKYAFLGCWSFWVRFWVFLIDIIEYMSMPLFSLFSSYCFIFIDVCSISS